MVQITSKPHVLAYGVYSLGVLFDPSYQWVLRPHHKFVKSVIQLIKVVQIKLLMFYFASMVNQV